MLALVWAVTYDRDSCRGGTLNNARPLPCPCQVVTPLDEDLCNPEAPTEPAPAVASIMETAAARAGYSVFAATLTVAEYWLPHVMPNDSYVVACRMQSRSRVALQR